MNAKRRVAYLKGLLKEIGLEPERVQMYHVSSAQAVQFTQAAKEMNELITTLGPSPLRIVEDFPETVEVATEKMDDHPDKGNGS